MTESLGERDRVAARVGQILAAKAATHQTSVAPEGVVAMQGPAQAGVAGPALAGNGLALNQLRATGPVRLTEPCVQDGRPRPPERSGESLKVCEADRDTEVKRLSGVDEADAKAKARADAKPKARAKAAANAQPPLPPAVWLMRIGLRGLAGWR